MALALTLPEEELRTPAHGRSRGRQEKQAEYRELRVKECWLIDRIRGAMTVYSCRGGQGSKRVVREAETCTTPLVRVSSST